MVKDWRKSTEFVMAVVGILLIVFLTLMQTQKNQESQPQPPDSLKMGMLTRPVALVFNVKLTGYSNDPISINVPEWLDGRTATDTLARRGVCAADWRIFPVGTVLVVPGYGHCRVEDRGSAVKGAHLDLFFDSYKEARAWGVKYATVEVIRKES